MLRQTALVVILAVSFTSFVHAQSSNEEEPSTGVFIDFAYGWSTIRGNDVHVADRTTLSSRSLFDESSFERLVTEMSSEWMPYVRAGYRGDVWGVEGEIWRIRTAGQFEDSFAQSDIPQRPEIIRMWDYWHGEHDSGTRYSASNDLELSSFRLDLTRTLTPQLSLAVGLHVAQAENERVEGVTIEDQLDFIDSFLFDLAVISPIVERTHRSTMKGSLLGPSIGLRGSASFTDTARLGYSLAQSVLFTEVDHEADFLWTMSAGFLDSDVTGNTSFSTRAAVPVTDLRASFGFDIGEQVSIGVLGLVSVWYDVPTAIEYSARLEVWNEVHRTLVFASVGPMVTIRF